jgi:regulator of sigma E protease
MLLTVVTFIAILGVLILVHELGHFLSARIFGVKAEEFGFGYPPRLIGWVKTAGGRWRLVGPKESPEQYEHTVWSLNWLPLGGFVKIKGEDSNDLQTADSFAGRPIWQRFIMLFAGVFMNFVLAFVLLSFAFASGVPSLVDDHPSSDIAVQNARIQIMEVQPDSPAAQAGLRPGDSILSIDQQKIHYISDVQSALGSRAGQKVELEILRQGKILQLTVTPEISPNSSTARIGVGLVKTALVKYPWYEAVYRAGLATLNLTFEIIKAFGKIIVNLITRHSVEAQVAGPIGIAVLTGQVVKLGWVYVLQFAALLSINLAIINLLPIPALDGGRIFFLLIEKIKGRPVKPNFEAAAHQWGFIFLMLLMLLVVFKDLHTYGQRLWQALLSVF